MNKSVLDSIMMGAGAQEEHFKSTTDNYRVLTKQMYELYVAIEQLLPEGEKQLIKRFNDVLLEISNEENYESY